MARPVELDTPNSKLTDEQLEIKRALDDAKKTLTDAGFKIITLKTSLANIEHYKSYTNLLSLPSGNKQTLLVPRFKGDKTTEAQEERNRLLLESEGFSVQYIDDIFWTKQGNIHCITGSLG